MTIALIITGINFLKKREYIAWDLLLYDRGQKGEKLVFSQNNVFMKRK